MTLLIYDDIFLQHDTGFGHPENARRLENTVRYLKENKLWEHLRIARPRAALVKEIGLIHHKPTLRPSSRSLILAGDGWMVIPWFLSHHTMRLFMRQVHH